MSNQLGPGELMRGQAAWEARRDRIERRRKRLAVLRPVIEKIDHLLRLNYAQREALRTLRRKLAEERKLLEYQEK